ncbi:MAG: hypothetical protein KPEEDBHJ_00217 [Anaerolineales bacterium]|jgi:hypothetical protein|nr:hypothetical protein [Anaerolineales bacterium]MCB0101476.1 hypothetical protein [Anaerolineales bacterium]HAX70973.1 hypothetical protein [Anaerolineae bacterium]HRJ54933.1 hypothetical protein [Anaerolineales bacterium]HRK89056.1 hypothetical protein [Anaerolineales bacterium]
MAKIIVYLGDQERNALQQLAQRELRLPRAQAALIIRQELVRQGMLPMQPPISETTTNLEITTGEPS